MLRNIPNVLKNHRQPLTFILLVALCGLLVSATGANTSLPIINVPHFDQEIQISQAAIFWFGQVDPSSNYADVRVSYSADELVVNVSIFDQWLWYDATPDQATLTNWDAVTLYLSTAGNTGNTISSDTYRFEAQLNHWQNREAYQAAYQGNGSGWEVTAISFATETGWRGDGLNGDPARGWWAEFHIPFTSLGLAGTPATGTLWGVALTLHDRDTETGDLNPIQSWPIDMTASQPGSWGQLHFGMPTYHPPLVSSSELVTVRDGLGEVTVSDAHVGGHTTCGAPFAPDFFNGWGDANYAGYDQINIQHQSDIADWPCFSKYYVTFPLDQLPSGKAIVTATLTLYQFGNSDPNNAQTSNIHVLTTAADWDETTLTWNNAPLATENIAVAQTEPLTSFPGWPGVPTTWDVSRAAAEAYATGTPVRLALYSSDSAYHSGKYFSSSDTGDWNAEGRPTLTILLGDPIVATDRLYLPLITQ